MTTPHTEIGKLWAEALGSVDITIPRAEEQKALTQIKGVPTALANITFTSALSLIACRREFQP
jgi:hypothetical protein